MEAAVKECIRDELDHERRLREMPAKRYIVRLTEDKRTELLGLITKGITSARLLTRAYTVESRRGLERQSDCSGFAMKDLVDVYFPNAERIRVLMDNLNTHTIVALYNTFEPAEAGRIARKLEIHTTPKHGSWLNMAEIELSVFGRECLNRRIPDVETLKREVAALEAERNAYESTTHWRFTTADARIKLRRLYPSYSE
jgi:hypothetical protein